MTYINNIALTSFLILTGEITQTDILAAGAKVIRIILNVLKLI